MADQIMQIVDASRNFRFLAEASAIELAGDAALAESYIDANPSWALMLTRRFGETLAESLIQRAGLNQNEIKDQNERIGRLVRAGMIPGRLRKAFHLVRTLGNAANHKRSGDRQAAMSAVKACFELGAWWYKEVTGRQLAHNFDPSAVVETASLRDLLKNVKDQLSRLHEVFETKVRLIVPVEDLVNHPLLIDQLGDRIARALTNTQPRRSELIRLPGLSGLADGLVPGFEQALAGVLDIHREISLLSSDRDPWLLQSFETAVLERTLGDLRRLVFSPAAEPVVQAPSAEILLIYVALLYVDAVLRVEATDRSSVLARPDLPWPQVLVADLERAYVAAPTIAARLRDPQTGDDSGTLEALQLWISHQAAFLSPSIWEGQAARRLAKSIADCIEAREGGRQEELATLIRRIGQHVVYSPTDFCADDYGLRLPQCAESLTFSPSMVAWLTRFVWHAALDPRRAGQRVAEHLGMRSPFHLEQAVNDMRSAQWVVDGHQLRLDAWCSQPAVAQALFEHVQHVASEIEVLRRNGLAAFDELYVSDRGIRPRTHDHDGKPVFQLPLVRLGMSQDETRRLLMGTALYGRPELVSCA